MPSQISCFSNPEAMSKIGLLIIVVLEIVFLFAFTMLISLNNSTPHPLAQSPQSRTYHAPTVVELLFTLVPPLSQSELQCGTGSSSGGWNTLYPFLRICWFSHYIAPAPGTTTDFYIEDGLVSVECIFPGLIDSFVNHRNEQPLDPNLRSLSTLVSSSALYFSPMEHTDTAGEFFCGMRMELLHSKTTGLLPPICIIPLMHILSANKPLTRLERRWKRPWQTIFRDLPH